MLKQIMISAACTLCSILSAETIGNVEFQFPPSQYEWRIFADDNMFFFNFDLDEEEESDETQMKMFMHREGDALEMFIAVQTAEDDEDALESNCFSKVQESLNTGFNAIFPNHKMELVSYKESISNNWDFEKNQGEINKDVIAGWELCDEETSLMHGYSRLITNGKTSTLIGYMTTALPSEPNRALWTQVLNDAK